MQLGGNLNFAGFADTAANHACIASIALPRQEEQSEFYSFPQTKHPDIQVADSFLQALPPITLRILIDRRKMSVPGFGTPLCIYRGWWTPPPAQAVSEADGTDLQVHCHTLSDRRSQYLITYTLSWQPQYFQRWNGQGKNAELACTVSDKLILWRVSSSVIFIAITAAERGQ